VPFELLRFTIHRSPFTISYLQYFFADPSKKA
jgi:hypothetical protein